MHRPGCWSRVTENRPPVVDDHADSQQERDGRRWSELSGPNKCLRCSGTYCDCPIPKLSNNPAALNLNELATKARTQHKVFHLGNGLMHQHGAARGLGHARGHV
ncbi:hypothetical protein FACUT_13219 [Fusarium acutatum]|uniref:Uncharacterized protein n=1 Tax=Fusarium acutatum TaxID=78861 RepID=A0A8H4JAI7_9HYPO|nr:hypothetical protein FACUT_13219 [Fusarium acutatum]